MHVFGCLAPLSCLALHSCNLAFGGVSGEGGANSGSLKKGANVYLATTAGEGENAALLTKVLTRLLHVHVALSSSPLVELKMCTLLNHRLRESRLSS